MDEVKLSTTVADPNIQTHKQYAEREESLRDTKAFLKEAQFLLQNNELSSISPAVVSQVSSLLFPQKPKQWATFQAPGALMISSLFSHSQMAPSLGTAEEIQTKLDSLQSMEPSAQKEIISHLLQKIDDINKLIEDISNARNRYTKG
jgi:hypothetical protein